MVYEKQTFQDGEILSADQLNHIEDGIKQLSEEIPEVKDGIWWAGIPDNIIMCYDSNGIYKDLGKYKIYHGTIMQGDNPLDSLTAEWAYQTTSDDILCELETTDGPHVNLSILSMPTNYPSDRTNDRILLNCTIEDITYSRTIYIQYSKDGERGPQGNPGVYIGSGEMPEGYSFQIDPDGEPNIDLQYNPESNNPQSGKAVAQAIEQALSQFVDVSEVGQ